MSISLQKLDDTHQNSLYIWRNADAESFGDTRLLSRDDQEAWFYDKYLPNPSDHMYMIMVDGHRAGTIGIRVPTYEIQRVLLGDKTYARTGVMSSALTLLMKLYGVGEYHLYVKQDNERAINFYKKNRFRKTAAVKSRPGMISMSRQFHYTEMISA